MTTTGRFAPSPTGPLHMGSLVAALASYCDIKQQGGRWFVRIDDLDPPRQDPQATAQILSSLNAHGLLGDQPVDYQSKRSSRYADAFAKLHSHLFYCNCPRKSLADLPSYPGTCRGYRTPRTDAAVRIEVGDTQIEQTDGYQKQRQCDLAADYGDFIVKRRDGLWAYNFATAIDDGHDVTHVVRGADLFHVTPQQIFVMQLLGLETPQYTHIPVLRYNDGTKLSKQTQAPALVNDQATNNLIHAFTFLGMKPPVQPNWHVNEWLRWGVAHWQTQKIPMTMHTYPLQLD